MKTVLAPVLAAVALSLTAFCAHAADPAASAAWTKELAQWRADSSKRLQSERGWLSIVTRDELTPGKYRVGSGPDNEVRLPKALAPATLGTIEVGKDGARLQLAPGQKMRTVTKGEEGEAFTTRELVTGATRLEWVTSGRLSLQIVKRDDGKIVVRAADRDSPRRTQFAGRQWFEPDARYMVPARFVPHADGATFPIANVRGEISYEKVAGTLEFVLNGQKTTLDALDDDGNLFIIFRDATSESSTYPPGRFLYIQKPADGKWMVDLNRAYNPPCAFSAFTTCPLPPPQNWLKAPVAAGERYVGRKS